MTVDQILDHDAEKSERKEKMTSTKCAQCAAYRKKPLFPTTSRKEGSYDRKMSLLQYKIEGVCVIKGI
jgi:hypothetical protein